MTIGGTPSAPKARHESVRGVPRLHLAPPCVSVCVHLKQTDVAENRKKRPAVPSCAYHVRICTWYGVHLARSCFAPHPGVFPDGESWNDDLVGGRPPVDAGQRGVSPTPAEGDAQRERLVSYTGTCWQRIYNPVTKSFQCEPKELVFDEAGARLGIRVWSVFVSQVTAIVRAWRCRSPSCEPFRLRLVVFILASVHTGYPLHSLQFTPDPLTLASGHTWSCSHSLQVTPGPVHTCFSSHRVPFTLASVHPQVLFTLASGHPRSPHTRFSSHLNMFTPGSHQLHA